ncbi:hypothetical protein ACQKWADRAFT_157472 [Trichoderma austrokoningii]
MGFYYSLFLFYNATRLAIRQRATDSPTSTYHQTKQINTSDPERPFYEKLDGTLSWIDAVSMIIPMLERRGGAVGRRKQKSPVDRAKVPRSLFSTSFIFQALSYFLIKQSSGFI